MKKFLLAIGAVALLASATGCNGSSSANQADKAFGDSLGRAFGTFFGQNIKGQEDQIKAQFGDKFNEEELKRGIEAAAKLDTANISYIIGYSFGMQIALQCNRWNEAGVPTNPQQIAAEIIKSMNDTTVNAQDAYIQFQMVNSRLEAKMRERQEAAQAEEAAKNGEAAEKYVAEQKAADSAIQTTESGLSYKIENAGEEPKAGAEDEVEVIYTGKHINGEVFDSSNGEPVKFRLTGVVPGFSEGLQLLGKGGKATLYLPGELAYGKSGQPRAGIAPNEMLVFEVELVNIVPAQK